MKRLFILSLFFTLSVFAESPDALIDRIIIKPGGFLQMCGKVPEVSPKVPLPVYRMLIGRCVHLSADDDAAIQSNRKGVAAALVKRLASFDLSQPPPSKPGPASIKPAADLSESSGADPRFLNGLLLEIIIHAQAVETLPELLRIEGQLNTMLTKAEADPNAPLPTIQKEGVLLFKKHLSKREEEIAYGWAVQREVLSTMLQLLRAAEFKPLLDSGFEKIYFATLKARAEKEDLRGIKSPEEAKAKHVGWDAIHQLPYLYPKDQITYSSDRARPSARAGREISEGA